MRTVVLSMALVAFGCAHKAAEPAKSTPAAAVTEAPKKSLYERLGGRPAITAVVDQFVANVAADKRINMRFMNTDIPHLKVLLVEFVCTATGGPEKYEGRDMHTSHGGMQLVDEEFNALVEDLGGGARQVQGSGGGEGRAPWRARAAQAADCQPTVGRGAEA